MKLLTVTVPCYNSQDYMDKCVESLLAGGERVQIVIVDDGSTDNTGAIADSYARRYPDIVEVCHQENGGHGEGINQGLARAMGKYFKVVDSDDWVSPDFPCFLDALEQCERDGGADLVVTNYYYEHADGKGDRSICYANALPEGRPVSWQETRHFRIDQLLTIHSCTFRTAMMQEKTQLLPKHIFYEDNLMIYQALPHVQKILYLNMDLYRYYIGRQGQSVQRDVMMKRYRHQLLVTQRCFETCHLDEVQEKRLRAYLRHELFIMFGICLLFTRINHCAQADEDVKTMWKACKAFDARWAKKYRYGSALCFLNLPGTFGYWVVEAVYFVANHVVRFN